MIGVTHHLNQYTCFRQSSVIGYTPRPNARLAELSWIEHSTSAIGSDNHGSLSTYRDREELGKGMVA